MDPYNPADIIKYLDATATQEEKDFINSPAGKESYEKFKKMWEECEEEAKNAV